MLIYDYTPLFECSSHAITSDVSLAETAKAAEFFMADGVIVTGQATGDPALPSDFKGITFKPNPILCYWHICIYWRSILQK
jgi:predicted TIM-barrel enzyme